jgi:hypothetical protein
MKKGANCNACERLLYLTDDEMNPQERSLISEHLKSCTPCSRKREEFLATRAISLRMKDAIPDLPDFITPATGIVKTLPLTGETSPFRIINPAWSRTMQWIRYSSAIASVLLVFLFFSEQAVTIRKISRLENSVQTHVRPSSPGLTDRIAMARSLLTVKEWEDLNSHVDLGENRLNAHDLYRIRKFVENRLESGSAGFSQKKGMFSQYLVASRNALTIKKLLQ